MVEVFQTNVTCPETASRIVLEIKEKFPQYEVNFDLEDIDRILRVEGASVNVDFLRNLLKGSGFDLQPLPD